MIEVGKADTDFAIGGPLVRSEILGLASLRIIDWVSGIVTEGVDYLNTEKIVAFFETKNVSPLAKGQAKTALESFSALGKTPYSEKTSKPDVKERTRMGIFENRFIDRTLTIEKATALAMDYMEMLANVKRL